jgi:hypothetical protein
MKNSPRWFDLGTRLAAANVSYRLLVAGDDIVEHPLAESELRAGRALLVPERNEFLPADQRLIEDQFKSRHVFTTVDEALAGVAPAVKVQAEGAVRALPRVKPGAGVVHLLNYGYDPERDDVRPLNSVQVQLDLKTLGLAEARSCQWITPEAAPAALAIRDGRVEVPRLGLWGLLTILASDPAPSR